MTILCLFIV